MQFALGIFCRNSQFCVPLRLLGLALLLVILQTCLDRGLERLRVGADDLADFLAILEENERGHRADTEFLRNVGHVVDVELVEFGVLVLIGVPGLAVLDFASLREDVAKLTSRFAAR
jgi:hypothetical protein